jgi:hypothetical protein
MRSERICVIIVVQVHSLDERRVDATQHRLTQPRHRRAYEDVTTAGTDDQHAAARRVDRETAHEASPDRDESLEA